MKKPFFTFILVAAAVCTQAQKISPTFKPFVKYQANKIKGKGASDGNIFIYGDMDLYENDIQGKLLKVDPNGKLVEGFERTPYYGIYKDVYELSSGKILALRGFNSWYGNTTGELVRLHSNGSVDDTFTAVTSSTVVSFALQGDSKIIVAESDPEGNVHVSRVNEDGVIDTTFNEFTKKLPVVLPIAIDESDRIYIPASESVIRLNPDGTPDESYVVVPFSFGMNVVNDFTLYPDGRVLLSMGLQGTPSYAASLVRLESDGTNDDTFTPITSDNVIRDPIVTTNNNVRVCGDYSVVNGMDDVGFYVLEFNSNGAFTRRVVGCNSAIESMFEDIGNNLYLSGDFISVEGLPKKGMGKLSANGEVDGDFNLPVSTAGGHSMLMALQSGGRLIVGNGYPWDYFTGVGDDRSNLIRLLPDGSHDDSFNSPFPADPFYGMGDSPTSIAVQEDDKLVIGTFNRGAGIPVLFRTHPNGEIDSSFFHGDGFAMSGELPVIYVVRYANGKIYAAGSFDSYDGYPANNIVVLDKDGNFIGPEDPYVGALNNINDIEFQSDRKFVITVSSGPTKILRFNADGTYDHTYRGTITGNVWDMTVDASDNVWVAGSILGNNIHNMIMKFNHSGVAIESLDFLDDFKGETALMIKAIPGNRLFVGGQFESYKGEPATGAVVIKPSGTRVPFVTPYEYGSLINGLAFESEQLYIHGKFYEDDASKVGSIRKMLFHIDTDIDTLIVSQPSGSEVTLNWDGNFKRAEDIKVEVSKGYPYNFQAVKTLQVNEKTVTIDGLEEGAGYYFRIRGTNEMYSSRSILNGINVTNFPVDPNDPNNSDIDEEPLDPGDPEIVAGIEEEEQSAVSFYPNPFTDKITVTGNVNSMITLFSSTGAVISNKEFSQTTDLNTSELPPGMYFIKIGEKRFKMIKE